MRILIVSDTQFKKHPFGKLLIEDLQKNKIEVLFATADENYGEQIYNFRESLISHNRRKRMLQNFKGFYLIRIYLKFDLLLSKLINRFFWRKIIHLKAIYKVISIETDIIMASRANVMLAVLLYRIKNYSKPRNYFYLPYEIYGHQTIKYSYILKMVEKLCIKKVFKYVITQSAGRANYYRLLNPNLQIIICRNFKRFEPRIEVNQSGKNEGRLIYLGLLINGRSLDVLINSLKYLPNNYELTLVGPSPDNWVTKNKDLIKYYIDRERLHIKPEVASNEIDSVLAKFDIGLISYSDSCLNNRLCCPAKLTDYLHCGLEVVGPDLEGMIELKRLNSHITLHTKNSPKSLAKSIMDTSVRSKNEVIESATNLNWNDEFNQILKLLKTINV
jgi:hypothetical protein